MLFVFYRICIENDRSKWNSTIIHESIKNTTIGGQDNGQYAKILKVEINFFIQIIFPCMIRMAINFWQSSKKW